MADDLTLIVNGMKISGWTSISVTRGIEMCPSYFQVAMTDLFPDEIDSYVVKPGDPCRVLLGDDQVINGYVDRVTPSIDAHSHSITIVGRGKCQDLVDCAAEHPNSQISGEDVLGVAQILVRPYSQDNGGIKVTSDIDTTASFPPFSLMQGETPMSIIERLCRVAALVAYEDENGDLFLTRAGTKKSSSGFAQGKNVQSASITYAMDGRFSEVIGYVQRFSQFNFLGEDVNLKVVVTDENVPRHRRKVVFSEAGDPTFKILQARAEWEVVRQFGRSLIVRLITDSWRDESGQLWQPNTLVPIYLPSLKLGKAEITWLISEVTYQRDANAGTTCALTIMPPEAFMPQPIVPYAGLRGVIPVTGVAP